MKQSSPSVAALRDLTLRSALHSELLLVLTEIESNLEGVRAAQAHVDPDLLERYALGRISDKHQLRHIEEHLLGCKDCRSEVQLIEEIRTALHASCPPEDAVPLYLEGGGSQAFRSAFDKHVGVCQTCQSISKPAVARSLGIAAPSSIVCLKGGPRRVARCLGSAGRPT